MASITLTLWQAPKKTGIDFLETRQALMKEVKGLYKFGAIPDGEEIAFEYSDVWAREELAAIDRLAIAPRREQVVLIQDLLSLMCPPFFVLYILAVPRGGSDTGRYQSASTKSSKDVEEFLVEFKPYLQLDGRHEVWVKSVHSSDQLVYDRHNVVYAYGDLPNFEAHLSNRGLTQVDAIQIPSPHVHYYHSAFDPEEVRILEYWSWIKSPLREGDEQ
jgi:hypothetical protein